MHCRVERTAYPLLGLQRPVLVGVEHDAQLGAQLHEIFAQVFQGVASAGKRERAAVPCPEPASHLGDLPGAHRIRSPRSE